MWPQTPRFWISPHPACLSRIHSNSSDNGFGASAAELIGVSNSGTGFTIFSLGGGFGSHHCGCGGGNACIVTRWHRPGPRPRHMNGPLQCDISTYTCVLLAQPWICCLESTQGARVERAGHSPRRSLRTADRNGIRFSGHVWRL